MPQKKPTHRRPRMRYRAGTVSKIHWLEIEYPQLCFLLLQRSHLRDSRSHQGPGVGSIGAWVEDHQTSPVKYPSRPLITDSSNRIVTNLNPFISVICVRAVPPTRGVFQRHQRQVHIHMIQNALIRDSERPTGDSRRSGGRRVWTGPVLNGAMLYYGPRLWCTRSRSHRG